MAKAFIPHKMANIITIFKIATINYLEFDKDFSFSGESHNFWEMIYVDKGELTVVVRNKEISLKQGESFFIKPNEWHSEYSNHEVAPNVFIISFVCHSKAINFFKNKKVIIPARYRHFITSIMSETVESFDTSLSKTVFTAKKQKPIGGEQLIRINLEYLLIMLIRTENKNEVKRPLLFDETIKDELTEKTLALLHDSVYQRKSVNEICAEIGYSKAYLSKVFGDNTGYSLGSYMNKLKIDEAKKLLREDKYNITQISDLLAYSDPHYFSKVFRRVEGMSPREYLKSVKID